MAGKEISSDVSIRNLKLPAKGQIDVRVKNAPALYLRLSPSAKNWYLRARPPGEKNPLAMRMASYGQGERALTLKQAKEKAQQWKEDIKGGIDPRAETKLAKSSVFASVVDEFLARGKTVKGEPWKVTTADAYRSALKSPRYRKWANIAVSKLTEANVQEVINKIEEEGKYTSARRNLTYLQTFFSWCRRKKQGYIPVNQALPTDGIELEQSGDNARDRHLSPEEIKVFWQATEKLEYPWKHYYQLAILTGQRVGNVAAIKRSEIKEGVWEQKENKADRALLVPLNAMAQEVLADCPNFGDYYLTTTSDGPIHKSSKAKSRLDKQIASIVEEGNLKNVFDEPWVNHDLRRTLTTELRKLRIPRMVCSAILNHAQQGVTAKNYDQYEMLDEKIQALNAWNDYLQELINGKTEKVVRLKAKN
jgi:integrase